MKVKVLKPFVDLTDGIERKVGEIFECSKTRFDEIKAKLPEWVESVEDPKPAQEANTTKQTSKKGK